MACKIPEFSWCAREGNDFGKAFRFLDENGQTIDLKDYIIKCQLRARPNQQGRLLIDFIAEGFMKVRENDSTWLELYIPARVVDDFSFRMGFGDLRLVYNERTKTPFMFKLDITQGITRPTEV